MSDRRVSRANYDDVPTSALLRAASRTYNDAVLGALAQSGCDDLPRRGGYILTAMHWSGASLDSVIEWMGVTKQAVGQSVDALVLRGYLERSPDPSDGRRVNLMLTDRGKEAGRIARSAIQRVDRELRERVGAETLAQTRTALAALLEIDRAARTAGHSEPDES
jgi:DNA-binding MarR family transcriptional regulator